jgi:hypothetical protein
LGLKGGCALTDGIAQDCPIFQADATGIRIRDISPPPPEGYDPPGLEHFPEKWSPVFR